jgi:cytochrome c biogenesis protein CcdA/thiol-disulfide isomerase/thioredoxin
VIQYHSGYMILFILSFIAGILTVLAPCTLPLLPVIVGSSVSGTPSKRKALIITISLGVSIILFTFLLKVSTVFINIPAETWEIISGFIIIIFGIISLTPEIWEDLEFVSRLNSSSNRLLGLGYQKENFWGNVIIGVALGPVFSSCSPTYFVILATVLPQSIFLGFLDLLIYSLGLCGTLLIIAFLGQRVVGKFAGLSDTHGWFRRTLGVLFIILGISIMLGYEKKVEEKLLLSGFFDITRVEQYLLRYNDKKEENQSVNSEVQSETSIQKTTGPKAPEIVNPSGFINTDGKSITIGQFKGRKVVLLDVWTYSCINCQRTLPYVESWYEKYKDMGLVVIGLHTPEFSFEKVKSNVEDATKKYGLTYPIVMDNDYSTWTAFGNQYWPRKYLINSEGEIIYDHIGEGDYEETEIAIQHALSELNNKNISEKVSEPTNAVKVEASKVNSPETYFGAGRNEYFGNGKSGVLGVQNLSLPMIMGTNRFYLEGSWDFTSEFATSETNSKIIFKYNAKNVYLVGSGPLSGVKITILKDGKFYKQLFIRENELYTIIEGIDYGQHTLEIDTPPGLNAFTFTFG